MTHLRRHSLFAFALPAALIVALFGAGTSGAVDDTKPTPTCSPSKTDPNNDSVDPNTDEASPGNLEILQAFLKHDQSKGAEATTINIVVKNLDDSLHTGSSAAAWTLKFTTDKKLFVRSVVDYSGEVVFEHGELVENDTGNLPRYEYRGDTPGKWFEGENGVVQIVIPQELGGKAGSNLKELVVEASSGKTVVPTAGPPTPTRGLSYVHDDVALPTWAVAPCDGSTAPPPTTETPGTTTPPSGGGTPAPTTGPTALPVKLVTTKATAKKAKKGKTLALKVRSSEPITGLALQIRNAKGTFGAGKLAKVSGNGTVKLKLKKALKKGKYVVDLVGKDAQGRQRSTAANLTVR